jgi:hypothetical protein
VVDGRGAAKADKSFFVSFLQRKALSFFEKKKQKTFAPWRCQSP